MYWFIVALHHTQKYFTSTFWMTEAEKPTSSHRLMSHTSGEEPSRWWTWTNSKQELNTEYNLFGVQQNSHVNNKGSLENSNCSDYLLETVNFVWRYWKSYFLKLFSQSLQCNNPTPFTLKVSKNAFTGTMFCRPRPSGELLETISEERVYKLLGKCSSPFHLPWYSHDHLQSGLQSHSHTWISPPGNK